MITRTSAQLRVYWDQGQDGATADVGKFVTLSADGSTISIIADKSTTPHGVVSTTDACDPALGNGAEIALLGYPGVVQVKTNNTPGNISAGTRLALCADGTVKADTATSGDIVVGYSLSRPEVSAGGQLIEAVIYDNPAKN